jgi:hypothetical protein
VPILARKPGALRNGAPFKDWVLPAALEHVRHKLAGTDDGDRHGHWIFFVILALFGVLILAICLTRTAGVQRQVLKSGAINLACLIILAALFKILSGII